MRELSQSGVAGKGEVFRVEVAVEAERVNSRKEGEREETGRTE
jgi:hypothetical protein